MAESRFPLTDLEYTQPEASYLITCYGCCRVSLCISSAVDEEVY